MSGNNLKRLLADVVSIDAWHTPFDGHSGVASIHIDAVFGEARLGGEQQAPVRFRLSLKRAEVVVIVPASEPLAIQKASVSRDQPSETVHLTRRSERNFGSEVGLGFKPKFPVAASINANIGVHAGRNTTEVMQSEQQLSLVLITQSKTPDGYYRWECTPSLGSKLQGRPWDPGAEPRLHVRDTRTNVRHLAGSMRVEVRCRREDLAIEDIQIKDESLLSRIKNASLLANKVAAVEAYLSYLLSAERLNFENLHDPYGALCVADVMVEESAA